MQGNCRRSQEKVGRLGSTRDDPDVSTRRGDQRSNYALADCEREFIVCIWATRFRFGATRMARGLFAEEFKYSMSQDQPCRLAIWAASSDHFAVLQAQREFVSPPVAKKASPSTQKVSITMTTSMSSSRGVFVALEQSGRRTLKLTFILFSSKSP